MKQKLKNLSGKEARFAKDVNHCISKKLLAKVKDTKRAIALEDLTDISMRVTVLRRQSATLIHRRLTSTVVYRIQGQAERCPGDLRWSTEYLPYMPCMRPY